MPKKKEAPALTSKVSPQKAGAGGGRTNGRYNPGESLKRRNPVYLKALESRSAGYTGRFQKNGGGEDDNYMEVYREPVKCKVVNFQGLGSSSHFCVSSDMMSINSVQSEMMLRSVGEQYPANCWGDGAVDDSVLTHRSDQSMGSTINLDSGHKQNKFHKEQLLTQLHERSAPLLKYLFASGDSARNSELHVDNISLPIRQINSKTMSQSHKVKHVIIEPKDLDQIGEDYVGALIPNSSRPLGYGLLRSPRSVTLSHKTLELPALSGTSKIFLPPVNPPPHPIRTSVNEPKVEEGAAYIDSVSQLVGMLCIEPNNSNNNGLPQHTIQKWLDT